MKTNSARYRTTFVPSDLCETKPAHLNFKVAKYIQTEENGTSRRNIYPVYVVIWIPFAPPLAGIAAVAAALRILQATKLNL